jgi:hypothetical protein
MRASLQPSAGAVNVREGISWSGAESAGEYAVEPPHDHEPDHGTHNPPAYAKHPR